MAENNKSDTKKDIDPELDELLDNALQDMVKKPEAKPSEPAPQSTEVSSEVPSNMWSEEFIKEAASQFESNMAAILGSFGGVPEDQITQDQIAQTFSKMAEAAAQVMKKSPESSDSSAAPTAQVASSDEVTAAISQTLQNLNTNAENLQTPFSDQDLANMLGNFNLEGGGQDGNMFVPFMQGMMQSLLSKEVLYPSLKELLDKYPAWLEENKGKIEDSEYERYKKQQELMTKVCQELEPEQESDPEDVKRKRFEIVLDLMQKMQDLGQPPKELGGDLTAPDLGLPMGGPDNAQCSIM